PELARHAFVPDGFELLAPLAPLALHRARPERLADPHRYLRTLAAPQPRKDLRHAVQPNRQDRGLRARGEEGRAGAGGAQHRRPASPFGEDADHPFLIEDGFGRLEGITRARPPENRVVAPQL